MGMSGYIMDLEEQFHDKVLEIVKESEAVEEAEGQAEELRAKEYPFIDRDDVVNLVGDSWNEFWGGYAIWLQ